MLDNPLLGPLVRGALRMAAPNLDPAEVTPWPALCCCTCSLQNVVCHWGVRSTRLCWGGSEEFSHR